MINKQSRFVNLYISPFACIVQEVRRSYGPIYDDYNKGSVSMVFPFVLSKAPMSAFDHCTTLITCRFYRMQVSKLYLGYTYGQLSFCLIF